MLNTDIQQLTDCYYAYFKKLTYDFSRHFSSFKNDLDFAIILPIFVS